MSMTLGQRVMVHGKAGTIRYMGQADFNKTGTWVGIELDAPEPGRHDGCVRGRRYFTCRQGHGIFCRPEALSCPPASSQQYAAAAPLRPRDADEPHEPAAKRRRGAPVAAQGDSLAQSFARYAGDAESVNMDGIIALCNDVGLAPDSVEVLVMAWRFELAEMGVITRTEWDRGMRVLGCACVGDLCAALARERAAVETDRRQFTLLYNYAFLFARDTPLAKVLDVASAAAMLELVLKATRLYRAHADNFVQFLRTGTTARHVNKDQWTCFLDFSLNVLPDLSNYDPMAAWPLLFDEYAQWLRNARK
eukprot:m51a1_g142 hypothetical protein (306) ;mRNA; r:456656-458158